MHEAMAISLLDAIRNGDQHTAKWILLHKRYSSLDKQSPKKDGTPLFWCCCKGYVELVQLLLYHGADINRSTSWGASPLHASADHNNVDILILLIKYGANVNQQTASGDTACHLAAYRGYKECVQSLAQRGANVEIRNNKRHTPIQEAYSRGHYDTYTYLLNVQKLAARPNQLPTAKADQHGVVKRLPTPPESKHYNWPTSRDTAIQNERACAWALQHTDLKAMNHTTSDSNSNIARPYRGQVRHNDIGVLRLNYGTETEGELNSDLSSSSSSCSSVLNDLSCTESSMVSSVPSMLSFKNI